MTATEDTPLDSRGKLLAKLRELESHDDAEAAHYEADRAILEFIDDPDITEAYRKIEKWYA